MSKTSKIKDIFEGEYLQIWEDDGYVYLSIIPNGITMSFEVDNWELLKKELKKVVK